MNYNVNIRNNSTISKEVTAKVNRIAVENDVLDIPDRLVKLYRMYPSVYDKQDLEEPQIYYYLQLLRDYAKKISRQVRHATLAEPFSILLKDYSVYPRKFQDLISFVGVKCSLDDASALFGSGGIISIRREKILEILIDEVIWQCEQANLNISIIPEFKLLKVGDDSGEGVTIDLPFEFKKQIVYPQDYYVKVFFYCTNNSLNNTQIDRNEGQLSLKNDDEMDGYEFEQFTASILKKLGYQNVIVTNKSNDQGIDVLAEKDEIKYGIQCKRFSTDIGNSAVQEAKAGKEYYRCHVGIVLTNRHFTSSAVKLANAIGIILWDREQLVKMINKIKKL